MSIYVNLNPMFREVAGWTPLHIAAHMGRRAVVVRLLQVADSMHCLEVLVSRAFAKDLSQNVLQCLMSVSSLSNPKAKATPGLVNSRGLKPVDLCKAWYPGIGGFHIQVLEV